MLYHELKPFEMFSAKLCWLSEVSSNRNITDTLTGQKLLREHISEKGPCSLNSITTALYTIHKRQQCTGCSFQLLFPQIPTEISCGRTMHFFPFEKKERKSISGFNTCGSRSIPAPALFFSATLFLQFSLHLWQMVNRNNGVWLLGGQGAAGGENKAADESA